MLVYVGLARPIQDKAQMTTELVNEFILGLLTHWLVIFTDFCSNINFKYQSGYVYILVVILVIIINLGQIVAMMVSRLVRQLKWKFQQFLNKFKRASEPKEVDKKEDGEPKPEYNIIVADPKVERITTKVNEMEEYFQEKMQ